VAQRPYFKGDVEVMDRVALTMGGMRRMVWPWPCPVCVQAAAAATEVERRKLLPPGTT